MKNDGWEKAKKIFADAIKVTPELRPQYLNEVCDGDADTRREVESLLVSYDEAQSFMESPAANEVADVIKRNTRKLEKGVTFGHYEIIEQIGAGGMGEVYLAQDKKLNRKVAIKMLNEKFARHESNLQRFIQEAQAASALNHPNILVIHEIGEAEDAHFIVSEFIKGKTLREVFNNKTLKLSDVLDISIQIANALCAAHEAHLIHRDVKPENIMIRPDGFAKVLDFGLAKLVEQKNKSFIGLEDKTIRQNQTAKGVILGTVNYMSPEQAKGEKIDARTDIFSLGAVIYEAIAGRLPFEAESVSETLTKLLHDEPPPLARFAPDVPAELQRVVSKMLRKNKDERYQTMKGLLGDLKDLRENLAFDERLEKSHSSGAGNETKQLQAATNEANKQTAVTQHTFSKKIKQHKPAAFAALAAFVVALTIVGYFIFFAASPINSIAVLPFENGSGNADLDYLSDGVSESVIDRLSQLPQLKVIARSSSFQYRGQNLKLQEIANALGVQAIVTGRVVQRGDSYTIRVEMIDARENRNLWSESFNRKASDIQTLQTDISREIADNLRLRLSGAQTQQLTSLGTTNPQAYELLLRGRFHFNKTGRENFDRAVEYYEQAIAVDPNYALAYAELAQGYNYNGGRGLNLKQILIKEEAAARRALELDANLAEAHYATAEVKRRQWQWREAEREYLRAIELNPNLLQIYRGYSQYLSLMGQHDEAVAKAIRGRDLDPLSIQVTGNLARSLYLARRFDEAITAWQKNAELAPDSPVPHYWLGNVYAAKEMYPQAIAEYQNAIKKRIGDASPTEALLGVIYAKTGERGRAEEILQKVKTSPREAAPPNSAISYERNLALLYDALGMRDEAFAQLEKAYAERNPSLPLIAVDPAWDNLRSDPRFQDLLRRVGLPQSNGIKF